MKKKKLVVLAGPTAIGKTNLSIELAEEFKTEIISADGRQFYKELNIGVAKPNQEQLQKIKHHFIGNISIKQNYSIKKYEQEGIQLINNLFQKYNMLFLCGGSGLYIDAICEGLSHFPEVKEEVRFKIIQEYEEKGIRHLQKKLQKTDIETYESIDKENPRRLIRALEVCEVSEKPFSYYKKFKKEKRNFQTLFISLTESRDLLYQKINTRTQKMIKNGLLEEAKSLYQYKDYQALQTIGYQEMFQHLDNRYSLDKAIDEIKKNSRRYAKRQFTWFKKAKYQQYNINQKEDIKKLIKNYLV